MKLSRRDFLKTTAAVSTVAVAGLAKPEDLSAAAAESGAEAPRVEPKKGDIKAPAFKGQDPFPLGPDKTKYRLLTRDYISAVKANGKEMLQ
ncbi:MAG TPA: twin-arginine translocation signal domain-containing protein, partial [Dissulfurispiraceae bacterium]|nr:twin-arginine translocation signal domain-containing protein [Dissulfurispiraceae bacterium]